MADNVTAKANTGAGVEVFATDDAAGVHHPYVKVEFGADNTQTPVSSANPMPVDGSGVTQPISGTITETNSTAILADTASMDTNLGTLAGAVAGSEMQVDIVSGPVTNAGTFAVQVDGDALTALQLIDDTVVAQGTALGSTKNSLIGGSVTTGAPSYTNGQISPLSLDTAGALRVTGGGGGTEYNEDDATPATIVGTATMMERDDALSAVTPIEGDWISLRGDANGALWTAVNNTVTVDGSGVTQPVSGTITANLSATDNAVLDDIAAQTSAASVAAEGAALGSGVLIQGDDGTDRKNINVDATTGDVQVDVTNTVTVDGSGVTQPISAASLPLPSGAATAANQLPDGHNVTIDNASGAAAVNIQDGGNTITVDGTVTANAGSGTMTVDLGANNDVTIASAIAHNAAASGQNPVVVAARATNSIEGLTQVTAADSSYITSDLNGCVVTRNATTLEELLSGRQTNTDGTEDAVTNFPAGGAGVHNYVTAVTVYNSHATTMGSVDLRDGTGGTIIWTFPAPATGGTTHNFNPPLKQPTANTQLFFDPSAAITTITISINGFQAQG
jgi:hypothetical protein